MHGSGIGLMKANKFFYFITEFFKAVRNYNEVFSGYQPGKVVHLTWLIARKNFIILTRRENIKSYIVRNYITLVQAKSSYTVH